MADQAQGESFQQQLAKALAALGGGVAGHALAGNSQSAAQANIPPELRALLDQSVQRQHYQDPLFQSVTQGAYQMLPTFMRQGTSMGSFDPSAMAGGTFGQGDSGGGINKGALAGGSAMAALAGMLGKNGAGGSVDLGELFKKIKGMFGGQGPSVQGNKPQAGGAMTGGGQGTMQGFNGWGDTGSDPFGWLNDPGSGFSGMPSDPSGGTGVGPGMQDYYNSQNANQGNTGSPTHGPEEDWWTGLF